MSEEIKVTQSSLPPIEEYIDELKSIWESRWLTNMGEKHDKLQNELKKVLNVENVELFTNGHMALELSLQAMGFQQGSEVITTPFTFASTTHAIVRNRLEPVFCDINEHDYTIDVTKIEELITDKTCAIMPVHVYGNICNIEEIKKIAEKHRLKVIYDAAHAFGEKYKGESVSRFGDISCFSFHATKVFNSIEGGAACFSDPEIGMVLYELKNFGIHGPEEVSAVGANAKMNEFCAAMGLCNLRHLNGEIQKRKKVYERYVEQLKDVKGIRLNVRQVDVEYNYSYFPIYVDRAVCGISRDDVFNQLSAEAIYPRKYFYPLTNSFSAFHGKYDVKKTPVALMVSENILTLPLYADLSLESVDRICDIIRKIVK